MVLDRNMQYNASIYEVRARGCEPMHIVANSEQDVVQILRRLRKIGRPESITRLGRGPVYISSGVIYQDLE